MAPEGADGPLALARTGDFISLDVEARHIDLDVPADELVRRDVEATVTGFANPRRGWERLYVSTSTTSSRPTPAPTSTSGSVSESAGRAPPTRVPGRRQPAYSVLMAFSMLSFAALRAGHTAASTPTRAARTRKIPIRPHGMTSA